MQDGEIAVRCGVVSEQKAAIGRLALWVAGRFGPSSLISWAELRSSLHCITVLDLA